MDRAALSKLKRAEVQKLAKRDGIKANGKTADMVDELLKKHHPLLVPSMNSDETASDPKATPKNAQPSQDSVPVIAPPTASAHTVPNATGGQQAKAPPRASPAKTPWGADARAGRGRRARRANVGGATNAPARKPASVKRQVQARDPSEPRQETVEAQPEVPIVFPKPANNAPGARSTSPVSETATQPAWDDAPPAAPGPAVAQLTVTELREAMAAIGPLASTDPPAQKQLRELGMLVDIIEKRNARVQERVIRMQKMRLALDEHFFAKIKEDPRLTNGTWTRPVAKEGGETAGNLEDGERPLVGGSGKSEASNQPEEGTCTQRLRRPPPESLEDHEPEKKRRRTGEA